MVAGPIARSVMLAAALLVGNGWALPAAAGEARTAPAPTEAELKARVKSLVAEALKAGDLWTAIQADAYASRKLGVRSSGVLGGSEIIGDPLFAFPARIVGHHQSGNEVVVIAGQRLHRLAVDGRPQALSQALPFVPHATAISADGAFVALAERSRRPAWALRVTVRNVASGTELFSATQPLVASDYIHGDIHLAPDGSAVTIGVLNDNGDAAPRTAVLRANGKHVLVPGFFRPLAIAPEGGWVIAEPASNIRGDDRHWSLLHGGTALTCRAVAAGPAVAALIPVEEPDRVQVIARDGTRVPLPLPRALASSARLLSAGGWLLVASGWSGQRSGEVDLLGNPVGPAEPYTTWFYRWSDLADGAGQAQPALSVPGVPGISTLSGTTVFVAHGAAVQTVDLTQVTPTATPLMTAVGDVRFVDPRHGRVVLWLRGSGYQIIDESGTDLWHGTAENGVLVHDPWFASAHHENRGVEWVRLAADPAGRKVTRLELPGGGGHELMLDRYHRRLLASRSRADWVAFDPFTATPVKVAGPLRPQVVGPGSGLAVSVFTAQWARLVPRLASPVVEDPSQRWNPLDAWRINGVLVVLDHHGQVHVAGRKRGTYQTLGSVDHPAMFAQTAAGDLMIASDENVGQARLAAGPLLATVGQGIGQVAQPLPEGPWRVKDLFFMPPRGGSLMWDTARCGFTPARLRSPPPPSTGLLVVTGSLVFDLDPAIGKQLGVIDRGGLRDVDD